MLAQFALVVVFLLALVEAPGYLLFRAFNFNRLWSACAAPLAGLSVLAVVGQVLSLLKLGSSVLLAVGASLAIALFLFALGKIWGFKRIELPTPGAPVVLLSLVLGVVLGYYLIYSRLDSLDAMFQSYDTTWHLNLIQAMVDSSNYSSINVGPYMSAADAAIMPINYNGFYPAAWHVLCAMAVQLTGASVTLAVNASMYLFPCIVFPVVMDLALAAFFPHSRPAQYAGALCGVSFVTFPWYLTIYGPVYANVAGFALMPVAMALFVALVLHRGAKVRLLLALLFSSVGLALCHPNVLFTCVLLLSPFCVSSIWNSRLLQGRPWPLRFAASAAFALFVCAFWMFMYKLPLMQATVSHVWDPYIRYFQGFANVVTSAYTFGFIHEVPAQLILAVLVAIGFFHALRTPKQRWMAVSYVIAAVILVECGVREDEVKQILGGFWYTDPMRLATVLTFASFPLATLGMARVWRLLAALWEKLGSAEGVKVNRLVFAGVLCAAYVLVTFMPNFSLSGLHYQYNETEKLASKNLEDRDWPRSVHTTYGDFRAVVNYTYAYPYPLTEVERDFSKKVTDLFVDDPNALVINNPMDGSFFLYGLDDLRVYYRNFSGVDSSSETAQSQIIRTRLSSYATDPEVQEAVKSVGAEYVLVLKAGDDQCGFINYRGDYSDAAFAGITSITKDTPGFTRLYYRGDMALYSIDEL